MKKWRHDLDVYLKWMIRAYNEGYHMDPCIYLFAGEIAVSPPVGQTKHVSRVYHSNACILFTIEDMRSFQQDGMNVTDMKYKILQDLDKSFPHR